MKTLTSTNYANFLKAAGAMNTVFLKAVVQQLSIVQFQ